MMPVQCKVKVTYTDGTSHEMKMRCPFEKAKSIINCSSVTSITLLETY
jgi:hypothetical protein